jgi:hypothetical protein
MICKGPNESYKYTVDWSNELGVETIATSSWVAEAGITIDSDTNDTSTTTVDLSGGTAGTAYEIYNEITTNAGSIFRRYIYCMVQKQVAG